MGNANFLAQKRAMRDQKNDSYDIAKLSSIYTSLKEQYLSHRVIIGDDFFDAFVKTKKKEEYCICFYIYDDNTRELINIGLSNNILSYLNRYMYFQDVEFGKVSVAFKFEMIRFKRDDESLEDFLKSVEDLAKELKPSHFCQDFGENIYMIKYKSPVETFTKKRVSKIKLGTTRNHYVDSLTSVKKDIGKYIRLSKAFNKQDEKEINDDDSIKVEEQLFNEEVEETEEKEIKAVDTSVNEMLETVLRNRFQVSFEVKSEKEIYQWETDKRNQNILFYRKIGGNSF